MRDPQVLLTFITFHALVAYLLIMGALLVRWPRLWLGALAVFFGLFSALVDLQVHEPQLPALLLTAGGFFLASANPRNWWRWALLIGLWVPVLNLIRAKVSDAPVSSALASLMALVPAFLGSLLGGAVVWIRARTRFQTDHPLVDLKTP